MKLKLEPEPDLSHRELVWDWERGEIIDVLTGEVVDTIYVNEPQLYNDKMGNPVPAATVVTPADPMHPLHLPQSSYEILSDVISLFVYLKSAMPIPCSIYVFENTVRKYLKSLSPRALPDTISYLGLIYIALEENNVSVDIIELAEVMGVPHQDVKSAVFRLKTLLNKNLSSFEEKTLKNIQMFCQRLELPTKVYETAVNTFRAYAEKREHSYRYTPRTLALATIYIALQIHRLPAKQLSSLIRLVKVRKVARHICQYARCDIGRR